MKRWTVLAVGLVACLLPISVDAVAQEEGGGGVQSIIDAILLPRSTQEAREAGVPESDIQVIFDVADEHELPVEDTRGLLDGTAASVREHGPVDNFGAFVQAQLDSGLRGRDLAAAIRAEHAAHGKGPVAGRGQPGHAGGAKMKVPDEAGEAEQGKEKGKGKGKQKEEGS